MATQTHTERRRVSYPVENLRVQVSALETAIAQVLSRPRKEAVHRLRAATRRVEAQLAVVAELARQEPGFAVERPAKRVKKLLNGVRSSAGRVRDLDVQRRLAKECVASGATKKLRREVKELREQLKGERGLEAASLVEMLEEQGLKLEPRLEALMSGLEPVAEIGMAAIDLEVLTRGWYASRRNEAERETKPNDRLHGIRKAAKVARYMAENGLAARVVDEFEALQEAGGRWHDCLGLREAAQRRLGKRSGLAALLKEQEAEARSRFQGLMSS